MKSKELKTKTSHADSLTLTHLSLTQSMHQHHSRLNAHALCSHASPLALSWRGIVLTSLHELHSGGYAYRLAPADAPLTEETFRKMALDFVGPSTLRWDGNRSTDLKFDTKQRGWETSVGTMPAGSTWRKNPIPSGLWQREGPTFDPGPVPRTLHLLVC